MAPQRPRPLSLFGEVRSEPVPGLYAEVAVDAGGQGVDHLFTYQVPPELDGRLVPGQRVFVPFGHSRHQVSAVIFRLTQTPPPGDITPRPILDMSSATPELTPEGTELALWLAEHAISSIGQAVRLLLPPGAPAGRVSARLVETLVPSPDAPDPQSIAASLRGAPSQLRCWQVIASDPGRTFGEVARQAGCTRSTVRALVRRGWVLAQPKAVSRVPALAEAPAEPSITPTAAQREALRVTAPDLDAPRHQTYLLFGVTGSGKTEVYLQAIQRVLDRGRQAIVLVPEIALTPQTVARFQQRFGRRVAVLHSGLGLGERFDAWWAIRRGEVDVVVGARSAVFAPCTRLGLIVVDEEHETSYKQDEAPRYHARDVALWRGRHNGVPVLLGSATPSLETLALTQRGEAVRLNLPERAGGRSLPDVSVVDMRLQDAGAIFSTELAAAMGENLQSGRQSLLFLNRRGFAPALLCPECGHTARCQICSVNLCYHQEEHALRCHYCGARRPVPPVCPRCGGRLLRLRGSGTERVASEVVSRWPQARVLRMDLDTTGTRGAHQRIYDAFRQGQADVLVGTQMVAKGWDIAGVTLVGVIQADTALHQPDYRGAERTFELLCQVAGRAGRGEHPGRVIVQTFSPDHYAIRYGVRQDFDGFATEEMALRSASGFPPFGHLVRLLSWAPVAAQAEAGARLLHEALSANLPAEVSVWGPSEAPIKQLRGQYRWHLALRGPDGGVLRALASAAVTGCARRSSARLAADPDPVSML